MCRRISLLSLLLISVSQAINHLQAGEKRTDDRAVWCGVVGVVTERTRWQDFEFAERHLFVLVYHIHRHRCSVDTQQTSHAHNTHSS